MQVRIALESALQVVLVVVPARLLGLRVESTPPPPNYNATAHKP